MNDDKMKYGNVSRDENGQVIRYEGNDEDLVSVEVNMNGTIGYVMKTESEYEKYLREPRGSKKDAQRNRLQYKKRNKKSR